MLLTIALIRTVLSIIFGIAGVTKLLDQSGTREAVKNFGAPPGLALLLAIVLPIVELSIAAGLLFESSAWWSALAALMMLGLFVIVISINLARGQTHDCHCFGQLYSRPLGWPTLARNIVFGLGAGFLLWQGALGVNPNTFQTIGDALNKLTLVQAVLLFAALAGAVIAFVLLQRRAKRAAENRDEGPKGLPIDAVAPSFELPAYDGGTRSLAQLLDHGKPVLLIFTNPKCGPCVMLFKEIREWQDSHDQQLTIALLSLGTIKENFVNVAKNRLGQVLLQQEREVSQQYGATVTPTAVVVNPNGRIASPIAAGAKEIRGLLKSFVGNSHGSNNRGN